MKKDHVITTLFAAVLMAAVLSVTAFADSWTQQAFTPDLTEAQAQEIAFNDAKIEADTVDFIITQLDFDDGRLKYEVDFTCGRTKYDYDIDAKTGEIISFSREIRYTGFKPKSGPVSEVQSETAAQTAESATAVQAETAVQTAESAAAVQAETAATAAASSRITYPADSVVYADGITSQEALQIALKHAGVNEADISRPKVGMDYEHGRKVYEIGFHVGWTEYDYDIDVDTGEIVKFSIEADD